MATNVTDAPISGGIAALLSLSAARFGDRTAVAFAGGGSVSFAALDRHAARFAGGLSGLGVGRGDRVVLHLANGPEWLVAYHAVARMGAVVVPANILLSGEELAFVVADSGAKALIAGAGKAAGLIGSAGLSVIAPDALTGDDAIPFSALLDNEPLDPVAVSPDDLFTIGYTSGTTGKPKGAMLSHGNVFASLALTATTHVRHAGDVVLSALPFSHVYGNIVMNAAFLCGYRLVAPARFDAGEALALMAREGVTLFQGVPTMYYQMLAHPELLTADLSSLTRCTVGGQTMPTAKIEQVTGRFGCPLLELWGMTEVAGPAVTHSPYWPARNGSIGLPAPGVEVRLAALDDPSTSAAPGEPGELQVRGSVVMQGYWNNPQATAQTIDADGWLATGDIARADADGYLFVVDRKKDMVITGGYNVYPAELEQVIAMLRQVAMVAVAGLPDDEKGEIACAYIVIAPGASLTEADVIAHCRAHLAAYKMPRRIIFLDDLPRTSTGKIMKRALAECGTAQLERTER